MARRYIEVKMLSKKDIENLAERRKTGDIVLSLYVYAKIQDHFATEANSVISGKIQEIKKAKTYSPKEVKKIAEMANRMKKEIKLLKLPDGTRSIAMFYSLGGMVRAYHIPVYTPSKFVIEADPYIHPLVKTMEEYPRYIMLALERDRARFFSVYLGEIESISGLIQSDVPQRINAARFEWKGLRENRIRGHIEDHIHRHLKKVAEKTADYFRKNDFDHLIIGAHKELLEKFLKTLDKRSLNKLVGSYHVSHDPSINLVKEKSVAVINDHERKMEEEIIGDLFNKSNKARKLAAIGIDSVLESLYLHNIDTLVIGRNYNEPGYVCPACHYISSYMRTCPKCKAKMAKVGDIADETMEEAVANKIKLKHLFYSHKDFDKFGIGAILKTAV